MPANLPSKVDVEPHGLETRARTYAVNALPYPFWHLLAPEGARDPWIVWWLVAAYMVATSVLTLRVPRLRRHGDRALLSASWLTSIHLCALAIINQMDPFYAIGSILSVTIPVLFNRSVASARQFAGIALVALILGYAWTRDVRTMGYWGSMVLVLGSGYWWLLVQQRTEDSDRIYRAKLEGEVAARTRELRVANDELRTEIEERKVLQDQLILASKMEGLGRLAGGIAHDYNNVLTAILGSAEYLEQVLPQGSPEHAEVRVIQSAGESAARITRHLLAFNRASPVEIAVLEPGEVISATMGVLQPLLPPGVRLMLECDHGYMRIQANRGQFEQVLLNLVLNARDAMPRGGIVRIETSARHENGRRWFVLRVSDSGTGMDPQTRARIFEPFFTTKGVASGTGLGLSIVYSIVERAGGTIAVESATGRGSTFQVFWPATEQSVASLDEVAAQTEKGSGSERILVVDDDPDVRRILCRMLVGLGYRPIEAGSGEQALRLAQSEPVDLIVTDVLMPEITGIDLARHLSELGIEAAVLFISGHPERTGARELRLVEGSEFLSKPFTRSQLGERVRKMLHARAQQPKAEVVC